MKRNCLLLLISFMLLLTASAFAGGDVSIKFNSNVPSKLDKVYVNAQNRFEVWAKNDVRSRVFPG
jgi:hypothetical protein